MKKKGVPKLFLEEDIPSLDYTSWERRQLRKAPSLLKIYKKRWFKKVFHNRGGVGSSLFGQRKGVEMKCGVGKTQAELRRGRKSCETGRGGKKYPQA